MAAYFDVMGQTALIPAWVAPTARAVADCHWIAHATHRAQVCAVLDWVTTDLPTRDQAVDMMMASDGAAYDTVVWLLGSRADRPPPIELPRRNPNGSVVTAAQLYGEYMDGLTGLPEQRRAAQDRAHQDAARYRQLAALVPH